MKISQCYRLIPLVCILLLPVFLNMYYQDWNSFLKTVPYIKNSSSLIRWIGIEIPLVILIVSLMFESLKIHRIRLGLVVLGIVGIVAINLQADRTFYNEQYYNPDSVTRAYFETRNKKVIPGISNIGAKLDENNRYEIGVIGGNDLLVYGISQLACYEPIFGYQLNNFPI